MLSNANIPLKLWVEALITIGFLINRLSLSFIKSDTPYFDYLIHAQIVGVWKFLDAAVIRI